MYLLDTHIILELRKAKSGQTDKGLTTWAGSVARQNLFMSALSLIELETHVTQLTTRDKLAGAALRGWLDHQVMTAFDGHILSVDAAVAKKRAHLAISDSRDALMAATASVHGLVLVTRNAAAYKASRIKTFNPWGFTPEIAAEDSADWRQMAKTGPMWFRNLFLRF
ncbi:PIN domain-containing protein [Asticcacaulis sp. SL142]|jgi:toxin FitB|uniref:PIN domain-containing protein n=1 Tax=Asticcacaulis sp. SL142 TaxID=2995155 RepID=UPI00226C6F02|nr:PIN domain-containing protein [Asticcacaulis sp. SL142]WAC47952.1 PIN domain-containing protein [Asticcacaulis sp. SL142]